MNQKCWFYL